VMGAVAEMGWARCCSTTLLLMERLKLPWSVDGITSLMISRVPVSGVAMNWST
jgi:hypothetical protein